MFKIRNITGVQQKLYAPDGDCVFVQPHSEATVSEKFMHQLPSIATFKVTSHTRAELEALGIVSQSVAATDSATSN